MLWTQAYVYIETLREPAIDNCLTPFFFVVTEMICESFEFDNFLKRLMQTMPRPNKVRSVF